MHAAVIDFSSHSTLELLNECANVLDVLRTRKITRSANNPLADYAEGLCARALTLTLVNKATAGYDATDAQGRKIEIKARRLTAENASRQLSAIRGIDLKKFDFVAGILFEANFTVRRGALIPHAVVKAQGKDQKHTNSWRFLLVDSVWNLEGVEDITARLKAAQTTDGSSTVAQDVREIVSGSMK